MINQIFGINFIGFLKKGGIHIKKKNRGKFTKAAKAAGESVQEYAAKVLSDPNATPLLKKRANFARNATKWKHLNGGTLSQKDKNILWLFNKKSSKSGLFFAGLASTPLALIGYDNYLRSKKANSRKWKHLSGGILEDRSTEKQKYDEWNLLSALDKLKRNFNIARQFISESPRLENVYNAALAMLGEYNPLNPYLITGVAPSVGRTPKIRKQSVSDVNNKGLLITKKFNTSVKNGMTYEDGDIRHLNRGPRSHDALARERARIFLVKYRSGTPEFKLFDKLTKTLAKRKDSGATNSVLNNIKKLMNSILDDLIDKGYVL